MADETVRNSVGAQHVGSAVQIAVNHGGVTFELPAMSPAQAAAAHRAQLAEISPDVLYDRAPELAELAAFCTGDEQYLWWQADPWAGKTALLSWFGQRPPVDVEVVSFFVANIAGQSDSDAFTDALIEQLAAIVDEPHSPLLEARARHGHALRLLQKAAEHCVKTGRQLLLIVDGLDEDTSRTSGSDRPSIAALLPRRLPHGVRVLIASRSSVPLPDDVPGDHRLRTINARPLTPSPYAQHQEIAAKNELDGLLRGPQLQQEILGLITASGGGLAHSDLEQLTNRPSYELGSLLGGLLGRSVSARLAPTPVVGRRNERVYLFTHETLQRIAEQKFGASLTGYQERLHSWADDFRARCWPDNTPTYLLRGHSRLLAANGDIHRMFAYATDYARHDWMLALTGNDALALTEIAVTADLIAQQSPLNLFALLTLALARDELVERNYRLPTTLPTVWVALGKPARAISLANGINEPQRASAVRQLVSAMISTGDVDQAELLADEITDLGTRTEALSAVATAWAATGRRERASELAAAAETTADNIVDRYRHSQALGAVVAGWAAAGHKDRARDVADTVERLAREIASAEGSSWVVSPLSVAIVAWAAAGDFTRAERLADEIKESYKRPHVLRAVVADSVALIGGRRDDEAARLAMFTERLARKITSADARAEGLYAAAEVWAAVKDFDRAERLANEIKDLCTKVLALADVAVRLAGAGYSDRAIGLATSCERLTQEIAEADKRAGALCAVVAAWGAAGHQNRARDLASAAEQLAWETIDPEDFAWMLSHLAKACVTAGCQDRAAELAAAAEQLARKASESHTRIDTMGKLAAALAGAGDVDRAEELASKISEPRARLEAFRVVVVACVADGQHDRARDLAIAAEATAREADASYSYSHSDALGIVFRMWIAVGDLDRAEQLADVMTEPSFLLWALSTLAVERAAADDRDSARDLATTVEMAAGRDYGRAAVPAWAATGNLDHAERLAREITQPETRVWSLGAVAAAATANENRDRAIDLATAAEAIARKITDVGTAARTLLWAAQAWITVGDLDRAEQIAHDIVPPDVRVETLVLIAWEWMYRERNDRTGELATTVETIAITIAAPEVRVHALGNLVEIWAGIGRHDRAIGLASTAMQHAQEISNPRARDEALGELASKVIASSGEISASYLSRKLVAEVISTSAWSNVLGAIAHVALPDLQYLCDVILAKAIPSLR